MCGGADVIAEACDGRSFRQAWALRRLERRCIRRLPSLHRGYGLRGLRAWASPRGIVVFVLGPRPDAPR